MINQKYWLTLIVAMAAGFIGSTLSGRVFMAEPAVAGDKFQLPELIAVKNLVIADKLGTVRGSFGLNDDPSDEVFLTLGDKNGNLRIGLKVKDNGNSAISLFDKAGKGEVSITIEDSGEPRIVMRSKDGKKDIFAGMAANGGGPTLGIFNHEKETATSIGLETDGFPLFAQRGKEGNTVLMLGGGLQTLEFFHKNNEKMSQLMSLGIINNGTPSLALRDRNGIPRIGIFQAEDESQISFIDRKKQALASIVAHSETQGLEIRDREGKRIWRVP